MKTIYSALLLAVSLLCFSSKINAQQTANQPWSSEDSAAINALVLYPDTVRLHIFQACEYPSAIVYIAGIQKNSSSAFADLLATYSKQEQEDVWNLSRYPDLISKIVAGGEKSKADINELLTGYPADIHDVALKYGTQYYGLLKRIDGLTAQTNAQFAQVIANYPPEAQGAFHDLITLPDVMTLLNDHLDMAVRVGDHFKRDPQYVLRKADSLNLALTQQNAADAAAWQQNIQSDTAAQNELKSAANQYAQDNGANPADVGAPVDDSYVGNYTVNPYPYWFGYPSWYPYSYWYPYPYWYDWGFYYNGFGAPVFIGHPSPYFTNWYFYHPGYWHRYPHLGATYINHYYGNRHDEPTANSLIVHQWVQNNRQYLPADFVTNPAHRVEAVRQVGQLHSDAQSHLGKNASVSARDQYLQQNSSRYPALNHNPQEPKIPEERGVSGVSNVIHEPVQRPSANTNMSGHPSGNNTRQQQPANNNSRPQQQQPAHNYNNIHQAQQYHQNTWEQHSTPSYHAPAQQTPHYSAPAPSRPSGGGGGRR